ncbi:MAG: Tol-Pal system beta propeller repeat protein TolB [Candidatus Sumerlaeia bacterium]
MSLRSSKTLPLLLAAAFMFIWMHATATAQAVREPEAEKPDITFGNDPITPPEYAPISIGIPSFETDRPIPEIQGDFFSNIIYKDLEMFSYFQRAKNQSWIEDAHKRDLKTDKKDTIDYAEWQRLGCHFVLKASFSVDRKDRITAECRLFNVTYGVRTFGLRYRNYPIEHARALAHRISDDIIEAVFEDEVGIASTKIVFVGTIKQGGGKGTKELFIMDADGHNLQQLTFDNSIAATPCWGKDSTEIYYTSYRDVNPDLCAVELGTGKTWYVSQRPGLNFAPTWSEKSQRIALTLGRDGNSEIYTMGSDGGKLLRLTYTSGIDSSPSWNPAGNQMVFTSDRTGRPQIWMMDNDGGNPHRLTHRGSYNDSPVWSPNGREIAFVARDQTKFDIYLMRIDGTGLRQLTYRSGSNEDPTWAPDSRHVIYSSNRTGTYQIYLMRSDGSNVYRLTNRKEDCQSPVWSPVLSKN